MLDQLDDPIPYTLPDDTLARARSRGTQLRRRRRAARLLAAVPILVVLVLGAGAAWVDHRTNQVDRVEIAAGVLSPVVAGEPYNVLVVGLDAPPLDGQPSVDGQRSDTQLVVRVDPTAGTLSVLALPRDLVLAGATERLNAKIGEGGPDALISAIHGSLGIPIAHYVAIDFHGFVRLVDAAGGVSVQAPAAIRDDLTGLQLTGGCQHLDGASTLALVRSRHLQYVSRGTWVTDPLGDLGRLAREQVVIPLVLSQLQHRASDPTTFEQLLTVFADNTTVDAGFSRSALVELAHWGQGIDPGQLIVQTLPVIPFTTPNGGAVLRPAENAPAVVDGFQQGHPVPTTADPAGSNLISVCT